jgi:hypothetical protein
VKLTQLHLHKLIYLGIKAYHPTGAHTVVELTTMHSSYTRDRGVTALKLQKTHIQSSSYRNAPAEPHNRGSTALRLQGKFMQSPFNEIHLEKLIR